MARTNQYFIYDILVQLDKQEKWDLGGDEDISCLFNTRNGECVIIGKILERSGNGLLGLNEPLSIDALRMHESDELIVKKSVEKQFDVNGEFHYYFVTYTR
jgi:hypothetical protein